MSETRTPKQIAADKLNAFGAGHSDRKLLEAGNMVSSLRTRVRVHMHPRDREEQNDG